MVELEFVAEFELEDELDVAPEPELEFEVAFDEELLVELELVDVVVVTGVAALVVGIVSVGAPAASLGPLPLPPQAASTRAASTAPPPARMARRRRLRTGGCI